MEIHKKLASNNHLYVIGKVSKLGKWLPYRLTDKLKKNRVKKR